MQEFLHMGGYATYVWSAYGITAVVLAATALWPSIRRRRLNASLRKRWQWESSE